MNPVLRGSEKKAVILNVEEVVLVLSHCKFFSEISFLTAEIRLKGTFCLNMFTTGLCVNMHIYVNYSWLFQNLVPAFELYWKCEKE